MGNNTLGDNNAASSSDRDLLNALNARAEKIEVERVRDSLEEANKQSFLKRRPKKFPYEHARKVSEQVPA
jgi:hypothetical protein